MTRVVNNILDMTRLESGPVQLDMQWYLLEETVGAVLGRLKGQLGKRSVDIDIPQDLPMLHVDGALFEKVLINLLENASKYTPGDAHISVCASLQHGEVLVQVIDDGPGIPAPEREKVFDRFHRADPSRARSAGGTGLGLAIVRAIVEAQGGHVWATDAPLGGARVVIELPGYRRLRL